MTDALSTPADMLSHLIRTRRSVRDFLPQAIPEPLLNEVLADANGSPSWSNTQPYRIAIASGDVRARLSRALCTLFDLGMAAQNAGVMGKLRHFLGS
jgi:nitroreductase